MKLARGLDLSQLVQVCLVERERVAGLLLLRGYVVLKPRLVLGLGHRLMTGLGVGVLAETCVTADLGGGAFACLADVGGFVQQLGRLGQRQTTRALCPCEQELAAESRVAVGACLGHRLATHAALADQESHGVLRTRYATRGRCRPCRTGAGLLLVELGRRFILPRHTSGQHITMSYG